jgi:hypothetical protein
MECIAKRDGQIDGRYIFEGETFEAKRCPSWATPVKKAPKAPEKGAADAEGKGES